MTNQTTSVAVPAHATEYGRPAEHSNWKGFGRHFGEMAVAMMPGCALGCALGGLLAGTWVVGSGLSALLMAFLMSLTMGAWMRYRRHGWRCVVEMSVSMFVAPVLLLPVLWLGGISPASLHLLTNAAMLPAMLATMLYRREAYLG